MGEVILEVCFFLWFGVIWVVIGGIGVVVVTWFLRLESCEVFLFIGKFYGYNG